MNKAFLGIALAAHELWLRDDERGNRFCAPRGSDLRGSDLRGSDLSGSNLSGSNLRGSNLRGSNLRGSDLRYSDLSGSNLSGSDLRYSNLRGSNLSGSDLSGSNLSGSDLRYSNLRGSNRIVGPQRSDGYLFTYCLATKTVRAGCQTKSIKDYIEHCNTYGNAEKKAETLAILKCLELLISARSAQ